MAELSRINPGPVKVTVARPLGRAGSHDGARAVEAVPPVVLDNETALGFLRDKTREQGSARDRLSEHSDTKFSGKRSLLGDRRASGDALERLEFDDRARHSATGFQQFSPEPSSRHTAPSAGFATHLMAQTKESAAVDPEVLDRQRERRHSQSSEAYRRAGAEPLLYAQASQVVSVAI